MTALDVTHPGEEGRIHLLRWSYWRLRSTRTGWRDPVRCCRAELRSKVLDLDGHRCVRCGRDDGRLHIDHIWPWSKGGPTTLANLQTLCGPCNRRKGCWAGDFRPRWRSGRLRPST